MIIQRPSNNCRSCVLVFFWVVLSLTGQAMGDTQLNTAVASADELAEIDEQISILKSLRTTVDRSQFEIDELIDSFDWNIDAVIEFVSRDIAFEQYPGVLRGAKGTLMSRAGSALDQALLLATLLKDTGADARIVRGNLSSEQAINLLKGMQQQASPRPPPVRVADWNSISSQTTAVREPQPSRDPASQSEVDIALETANLLETLLERHGKSTGMSPEELIEEARDYYWVEYRETGKSSWTTVHPAASKQNWSSGGIEPIEFYSDTIPAALQNHLRIEVFVERRELGKLAAHRVIAGWQRPIANLLGQSFTFSNYPNNFGEQTLLDGVEQSIASSEFFVPVLNGSVVPGSMGFDIDGVPYDLTFQGNSLGATALFRSTGDKVDSAAAALDGLGSDRPADAHARYLTAQWIEYTFISPGRDDVTHRRFVFDRIGRQARESGRAANTPLERAQPWQLLAYEEFMVAAGSYPESLALDEFLQQKIDSEELARIYGKSGRLTLQNLNDAADRNNGSNATVLFALLQAFDEGIAKHRNAPTYRSGATLLALHSAPVDGDRMQFSTDIVSNEQRSTAWRSQDIARHDLLLQGVWETVAERSAVEMLSIPGGGQIETPFSLFTNTDSLSDIRVVDAPESLDPLGLSVENTLLLESALNSGYWVVTRPHSLKESFSWWQFDPVDGTVVGMLSNGRGATVKEYTVMLTIGAAFAGAAKAALNCIVEGASQNRPFGAQRESRSRPEECCFIDEITPDGTHIESVVFKWAMSTDALKRKVGMDIEMCRDGQTR